MRSRTFGLLVTLGGLSQAGCSWRRPSSRALHQGTARCGTYFESVFPGRRQEFDVINHSSGDISDPICQASPSPKKQYSAT